MMHSNTVFYLFPSNGPAEEILQIPENQDRVVTLNPPFVTQTVQALRSGTDQQPNSPEAHQISLALVATQRATRC
jgi:hypothetical protein